MTSCCQIPCVSHNGCGVVGCRNVVLVNFRIVLKNILCITNSRCSITNQNNTGMSWIGTLFISSCTITFKKKGGICHCILNFNNSQVFQEYTY